MVKFIMVCSKLAEQRELGKCVKFLTAGLILGVSLWVSLGEGRILLPCPVSVKGIVLCSVKSS